MEINNPIYAFDIGTRSVTGLVAEFSEGVLKLHAAEMLEHENRSMHDGQIQDIEEVSSVIRKVKDALEKRTGLEINNAAVAAAGRSLITAVGYAERIESSIFEVSKDDINELELEALQNATKTMLLTGSNDYYCIDYNVTAHYVEGDRIVNPNGQRVKKMAVEIIATFLPRLVVDSLDKALSLAGMEMSSLTLEPIAASNVVIPKDMRRLNLVLLDIGAGTSDIAISRDDSIFAYGMVPYAGDEVTEKICEKYLVDFTTAETMKRQIASEQSIVFNDVLGLEQIVSAEDLSDAISPAVDEMADRISDKIIELNGKTPDAVICVGGGSMTPELTVRLSKRLGLDKLRVAVRGTEAVKNIEDEIGLKGPIFVTPLGIAYSHIRKNGLTHCQATVNGKEIRLFNLGKLTVRDALFTAGIPPRSLFGRPGISLTYELNGTIQIVKGKPGSPAKIRINGNLASLEDGINDFDSVAIEYGENGSDAHLQMEELDLLSSPEKYKTVLLNGQTISLAPVVTLNDKIYDGELARLVKDRDRIEIRALETIADLLDSTAMLPAGYESDNIQISINSREFAKAYCSHSIFKNDNAASLDTAIDDGDIIIVMESKEKYPTYADFIEMMGSSIEVKVNSKLLKIAVIPKYLRINGAKVSTGTPVMNHSEASIEETASNLILSDIFRYVDIGNDWINSKWFDITLNGNKAQFTDSIRKGDEINIVWG